MRYAVTAQFDPHPSLWAEAYLYAGLAALAEAGDIALHVGSARRTDPLPLVLLEVCALRSGERKLLAFDHYDRSDVFNLPLLERCDLYFKRSCYPPDLARCDGLEQKVRPYGLVFPCHGGDSKRRIIGARAASFFTHLIDSPREQLRRLRGDVTILRQFLASPRLEEFQYLPTAPRNRVISFQTRLWAPGDTTDDADEINRERIAIVRALRREFGPRFRGGVVPTRYALATFPDVVTPNECNRTRYIAEAKRCLVAVYTRGLHHSLAYKLPEYLAASQCIVSCDIRNQLPAPLEPRRHYLPFTTVQQCVEECAQLLDNADLAMEMSRANHEYFLDQVHPVGAVGRCLDLAFAPAPAPAAVSDQLTSVT
jgi:hypothetical protein